MKQWILSSVALASLFVAPLAMANSDYDMVRHTHLNAAEPVKIQVENGNAAHLNGPAQSKKDYTNVKFSHSGHSWVDFKSSDMNHANLRHADLTGADFRGVQMIKADLRHALLSHSDLRGADLHFADLEGTRMHGAKYNKYTYFPSTFDPKSRDMVYVD